MKIMKEPDCHTFCKLFAEAKTRDTYYNTKCELKRCEYYKFFTSVSCLFTEGVEFMTKTEIYDSIKLEWRKLEEKVKNGEVFKK